MNMLTITKPLTKKQFERVMKKYKLTLRDVLTFPFSKRGFNLRKYIIAIGDAKNKYEKRTN